MPFALSPADYCLRPDRSMTYGLDCFETQVSVGIRSRILFAESVEKASVKQGEEWQARLAAEMECNGNMARRVSE